MNTNTTDFDPRSATSFVPIPAGVERSNGGIACDFIVGPCACGATHDGPVPFERGIMEEIRDGTPRPWGAAVGAALEACRGNGWMDRDGCLTAVGLAIVGSATTATIARPT